MKNKKILVTGTAGFMGSHLAHHLASQGHEVFGLDRPSEIKYAYCTNTKAKKLLGYRTTIDLDNGIAKTIEWAKKVGPYKFQYLNKLELEKNAPKTWSNKLI